MEDGENGAKRLLDGYIREELFIFFNIFRREHGKVIEMGRPKSKSNCD